MDVSDDGTVVVGAGHGGGCIVGGACFTSQLRPFRQVGIGPVEWLPTLASPLSNPQAVAEIVSGDGAVTAGWSDAAQRRDNGVRWNGGVATQLPFVPGDLSEDGSMILYGSSIRASDGTVVTTLEVPAPDIFASAHGLSPDGRIAAGELHRSSPPYQASAVWFDGVLTELPAPDGMERAYALQTSDDGRVVVGAAREIGGFYSHAVVWIDGVPQRLPEPDELDPIDGEWVLDSRAADVSGDGRLVLVTVYETTGFQNTALWDEANGLRVLDQVLTMEFGLVGAWSHAATALSRDGRTIVGATTNLFPREGFVLTLPESCANGEDDDADGFADMADPGCADPSDYTERGPGAGCDDGADNDRDNLADFPDDPSCASPTQAVEGDCTDGQDSDEDGLVDLDDPGCSGPDDPTEKDAAFPCDDGIDNDGDHEIDYPRDPTCASRDFPAEVTACSDEIDNDGDGLTDWWDDPQCLGNPSGWRERAGACGLGAELAAIVPALWWLRTRRRRS